MKTPIENIAQHTPGPWSTFRDLASDDRNQTAIYGNDGIKVACVEKWTSLPEIAAESEANARLIAAAPDLLAALEWAVQAADTEQYEACWYAAARAAIARAKGVQS